MDKEFIGERPMHGCKISTIEMYLPKKSVTNEDLALEFPDWSPSKIVKKIGIAERHVTIENETALDLAREVCDKLFQKVDKQSVDFLLFCTQSPDYLLPTSACILQDQLGLPTTIGALDFNLGCSGFVYGLAMAKGLISAKVASNVLLVTSETYSKHLHPQDRGNRSIFGDGAAACIVTESDENQIFEFALGTDGSGWENLIIRNKGMRSSYNENAEDWTDEAGAIRNDNNLYMNGPEIFNFTIEAVPKLINQVLQKNQVEIADIDYVVFHQANQYMLNYLRDIIGIPEEKFYLNMLHTGNTVSATFPIALIDAQEKQLIKKGDKVLLAGFGVGYSYGATIITV
jgi:3-oxoacyl-[acyl-carrier-protein] synthase III